MKRRTNLYQEGKFQAHSSRGTAHVVGLYTVSTEQQPAALKMNPALSSPTRAYDSAGKMAPLHMPNPTYPPSSSPARPTIVTTSPSSRKVLVSEEPGNCSGRFPPSVASRREPWVPFSVPLMVPEPSRSPTPRLHPVMVW